MVKTKDNEKVKTVKPKIPKKPKKFQVKKGAPKGNTRAVYHGCYSTQVLPSEKEDYKKIRNGSIEHELRVLRLRLVRMQKKEAEYLLDRESNGSDTEVGLELTEIERKEGTSEGRRGDGSGGFDGEETKKVRKRPDFDNIALRLITSIANLEKIRVQINEQTKNEEAERKKTLVLRKFRLGEINAVQAACMIEEAGLRLPDTISIVLKNTPQDSITQEAPEEYGFTEEELEARYQVALNEEKRQLDEFLPEREKEIKELKEEIKGTGAADVDAMIKKAADLDVPTQDWSDPQ
jgi:hypothetical protein